MDPVCPGQTRRYCIPNSRSVRWAAGAVVIAFACVLPGQVSATGGLVDDTTLSGPSSSGLSSSSGVSSSGLSSLEQLKAWVLETGDNHGQPFVIVDKLGAQVVAFDPAGGPAGSAPVLLGVAHGDDSPPGIGDRPLADIGPEDRITPAGRFAAELGESLTGKTVLWVDYDAAVSLHPVATGRPSERRQARLDSATPLDNRISYGCINVPAAFFRSVVEPLFTNARGIVYVIPETRSLKYEFFDRASRETPTSH